MKCQCSYSESLYTKCEHISCEDILQPNFLSLGWSDFSLVSTYTDVGISSPPRGGTPEFPSATVDYGKIFLIGRYFCRLSLPAYFYISQLLVLPSEFVGAIID
jgi:hypothetical protein